MFKITVSYTNPDTLIQNAKTNPERTVKQLYDMYLVFPQTFSANELPKHIAHIYTLGQFIMDTHAIAEPFSELINSCKSTRSLYYSTTGYPTSQVLNVLRGYLDNFAPNDWITFDPVTLNVSYPTTDDVIPMIKSAYHHLFTKVNLGYAFLKPILIKMYALANQKRIYKYQAEQAEQMRDILAEQLPFTLTHSKYLDNAKKVLPTSNFKHIVAKQTYSLANHGRKWGDTLNTLVNILQDY